ncbi:MAG: hypothetical protein K1X28_04035 [Parachlamydiales bacterium]|nr:hypothetical protein [Parachlamydiales bacterium]
MSISAASSIPALSQKSKAEKFDERMSQFPDSIQFRILSFLPPAVTKNHTHLKHGVWTILHEDLCSKDTVYHTVLRAIETESPLTVDLNQDLVGNPAWHASSKAFAADRYINRLIQDGRFCLTAADWTDMNISKKITKLLTLQEKAKVVEKIKERNDKILISFFRSLSPYIPEIEEFLTQLDSENLEDAKKAEQIRNWMQINQELLKTGDPIIYETSQNVFIPPEITYIFPRLEQKAQLKAIQHILSQNNTHAYRAIVATYKSDPVLGTKVLSAFVKACADSDHCWIEELSQLPEVLALPPFVITYDIEVPINWFWGALFLACRNENAESVRILGRMVNAESINKDEFNQFFGRAVNFGMEEVLYALGEWPQAEFVNLDYVNHPSTEKLEVLLEWAIVHRNINLINGLKDYPGSNQITKKSFEEFLAIAEDFGEPIIEALKQWPQAN